MDAAHFRVPLPSLSGREYHRPRGRAIAAAEPGGSWHQPAVGQNRFGISHGVGEFTAHVGTDFSVWIGVFLLGALVGILTCGQANSPNSKVRFGVFLSISKAGGVLLKPGCFQGNLPNRRHHLHSWFKWIGGIVEGCPTTRFQSKREADNEPSVPFDSKVAPHLFLSPGQSKETTHAFVISDFAFPVKAAGETSHTAHHTHHPFFGFFPRVFPTLRARAFVSAVVSRRACHRLEECGRRDVGLFALVATGVTSRHCRRLGQIMFRATEARSSAGEKAGDRSGDRFERRSFSSFFCVSVAAVRVWVRKGCRSCFLFLGGALGAVFG